MMTHPFNPSVPLTFGRGGVINYSSSITVVWLIDSRLVHSYIQFRYSVVYF